jgi:hypothetical protein
MGFAARLPNLASSGNLTEVDTGRSLIRGAAWSPGLSHRVMEGRMADFKKVPDSSSGDGPFDFINAEAVSQVAMSYRSAIAVSIAVILLQGWMILG